MSTPRIGEIVRDTLHDRVGTVTGHYGPYVQLRPIRGGCEWDAHPAHVVPVDEWEEPGGDRTGDGTGITGAHALG